MLLSFRVANHRSLRDEQELQLESVYDRRSSAVSVAAIYGANASGKSNVLDALRYMRQAVVSSHLRWDPEGGVPREPFALESSAGSEVSGFAVDLLLEDVRYAYGFAVDDQRVREEWLYSYPRGRRRVLFTRAGDDFDFGPSLTGPKSLVEEGTRPNGLFLSTASQARLERLLPVYTWFRALRVVATDRLGSWLPSASLESLTDKPTRRRTVELLRAADVGIADIQIREAPDELAIPDGHPTDDNDGPRGRPRRRLMFVHSTLDGDFELGLRDESQGTRAWFQILSPVLNTLDKGAVLAVDETDASLHPHLTSQLVKLFQDGETNPHGAQLIFATHDTSLLGTMLGEPILPRDQIWFVEKDRHGATNLYPLTDFRPRKGENFERRYLYGQYGAVPMFTDAGFVDAVSGRERE